MVCGSFILFCELLKEGLGFFLCQGTHGFGRLWKKEKKKKKGNRKNLKGNKFISNTYKFVTFFTSWLFFFSFSIQQNNNKDTQESPHMEATLGIKVQGSHSSSWRLRTCHQPSKKNNFLLLRRIRQNTSPVVARAVDSYLSTIE